jgi:hypothetical protein
VSRSKRSWVVQALLAVAIAVALVLLGLLPCGPTRLLWRRPSSAELDALLAEGDSIVHALDAYRAAHSRYPPQLPGSPETSRGAKYGGWRYACVSDCSSFELSVGHYCNYSFEIHRRFDSRTWYVDG